MIAADEPTRPSRRFKRCLLNQVAQRMAAMHFRHSQELLAKQLEAAELHGRERELIAAWQRTLGAVQTPANLEN